MLTYWLIPGAGAWLDGAIRGFCQLMPENSFFSLDLNVKSMLAVVLASLVCGAVGSLVVGNRMAFFSDALAHSAFAGVVLGFLMALAGGVTRADFWEWVTPVMIGFGILVAIGIAYVREKTNLASDTVIGVFFAGAIGFAAMLRKLISDRQLFNLEEFLFGDPVTIQPQDLLFLLGLLAVTGVVLAAMYNRLVFTSFNASLARSRRIPVRFCNYLFIILLALIVNVCLKTVGVLLINALLIVPAATMGNLARNMRQLFLGTILLCLGISAFGLWFSSQVKIPKANPLNPIDAIYFGIGGSMVVFSVLLFYLSMLVGPARRLWHRFRDQQPLAGSGGIEVGQRSGAA